MAAETEAALRGRRVLVTRPAAQAHRLCHLIEAAGGVALAVPTIEVVPAGDVLQARARLALAETCDGIVFISRNAVGFALQLDAELPRRLSGRALYAVGPGTRRELARHGLGAAALPAAAAGSAGLLQLAALQAPLAGRSFLIVRGAGGRELLRAELERRGARVEYAEVYRRELPPAGAAPLNDVWRTAAPDVIVATSNQGLDNMLSMIDADRRAALLATPLAVMSARNRAHAAQLGFNGPVEVAGAGDAELLAAAARAAAGHG